MTTLHLSSRLSCKRRWYQSLTGTSILLCQGRLRQHFSRRGRLLLLDRWVIRQVIPFSHPNNRRESRWATLGSPRNGCRWFLRPISMDKTRGLGASSAHRIPTRKSRCQLSCRNRIVIRESKINGQEKPQMLKLLIRCTNMFHKEKTVMRRNFQNLAYELVGLGGKLNASISKSLSMIKLGLKPSQPLTLKSSLGQKQCKCQNGRLLITQTTQ